MKKKLIGFGRFARGHVTIDVSFEIHHHHRPKDFSFFGLNLPRIFLERQTHWGKTKEGPFSGVLKRTGFSEIRQPTTQKKNET